MYIYVKTNVSLSLHIYICVCVDIVPLRQGGWTERPNLFSQLVMSNYHLYDCSKCIHHIVLVAYIGV